ncbi:putative phosphoglycerate mutase [Primorskyibacter sedentarius]|uniref:Putative phosphoglycerate mutase n=1 Tax=Primorskyibacter sedentarius TaxID=745311 RepID=A0A4R3J367_9RHOB|nr:histidine phosphatase family protein [Primorskyibacter sedentarius]TCS59592.1 putative phosphoglycerate mutase [Primorskyibacter sedentarius]
MTPTPSPSRSFCLIRHGETTANADEIIAGVTDVPLTRMGRDQARALLNRRWPEPISIYASPMFRAQHSAQLAFPGKEICLHEGLRERDWGVFEGQPLSKQPVREDTPDRGESWPDMLLRVQTTIIEICAASKAVLPVLVCHSGVIRAARVLWTTGDVGRRPPNAIPLLFEKAGNEILEKTL